MESSVRNPAKSIVIASAGTHDFTRAAFMNSGSLYEALLLSHETII
jgi:hypothetical protein